MGVLKTLAGSYSLEINLTSAYLTDMPGFEIWEDGELDSVYSVSSLGTSIFITVDYSGSAPSSLNFRFNDTSSEPDRLIRIQSVKINDNTVNPGNYLSTNTLTQGETAVIDVAASTFLYDSSEPAGSLFTIGITRSFSEDGERFLNHTGSDDHVFDMAGGRDTAYLGSGNDTVSGGADDDLIRGGGGSDLLYGDSGNDRLYGEDGDDRIYGGQGNDQLFGNDGDDDIFGNEGDDQLVGHDGNDLLVGGAGDDRLNGGNDNDQLFGEAGSDILIGANGDDTLDGGAEDDILYGGNGNDFLNGGSGNDVLAGNAGLDIIHGDQGDDIFYLSNGDWVSGEEIYGGVGNDQIILNNAMMINFMEGLLDSIETLTGSDGNDQVIFGLEQLIDFSNMNLGAGTDSLTLAIYGTVNMGGVLLPSISGVENSSLNGSAGNDTLIIDGAQLSALLLGNGVIDFGGGSDALNLTSTSLALNSLGTTLNASIAGLEMISAATAAAGTTISMAAQTENFTLIGSNFADNLTGGSGNDTISGGAGNDTIQGGDGNDLLSGGAGNDVINGGAGTDTADYRTATSGVNVNLGQTGAQNTGGAGTDTLSGMENLVGSSFNDTLSGNNGANTITGGAGADTFVFRTGGIDTITDFSAAQGDILDISNLVSGLVQVDDIDNFLRLTTSGGNTNVLVDNNGTAGGANYVQVGILSGVTGLNAQNLFNNGQVIEGGKVLCGHYFTRGILPAEIYAADLAYAAEHFNEPTRRGYRFWAVPLTAYLNNHPGGLVEKMLQPLVLGWAKEMAYRTGKAERGTILGRMLLNFAVPVASVFGRFIKDTDYSTLESEKSIKGFLKKSLSV
jgi:Ca2+-binding RTX toxin-like protein